MAKLNARIPTYRKHKPSGRAVVTIDGKTYYLGRYGTKASRDEYNRLIAEWLAHERQLPVSNGAATVSTLCAAFVRHATRYYRKADGTARKELWAVKNIIKLVRPGYGGHPVTGFGPLALKAVRHKLIERGKGRKTINEDVHRIKRIFKWGVENELVPASVYQALACVAGLRRGRTTAPEGERVKPVHDADVDAIRGHVSRQVWAMIELQRMTGMRPGEVVIMRGCDLDTEGAIWTYRPPSHKTAHRGHERVIDIGPKAQTTLRPFLRANVEVHLFRASDADAERKVAMRARRKSKVQPSQRNRCKTHPKRKPKAHYTVDSYRRAITRACKAAGVTPWHPHQLRHTFATLVRKQFGLDAARAVLGHRSPVVTEIYAEIDRTKSAEVVRKLG